jgi:hypothetical protein
MHILYEILHEIFIAIVSKLSLKCASFSYVIQFLVESESKQLLRTSILVLGFLAVAQFVEPLCFKPEGSGFDFQWGTGIFH